MDKLLENLYYNPKSGFLSSNHLYELAKSQNPKVTREFVKEWLSMQEEYQRIQKPKKILYHPIISHEGEYQADIIFMDNAGNNNKKIGLITFIHVPTRYAYAYPISNRQTKTITDILTEFIKDANKKDPVTNLTTDNELFNNRTITKLLKEHNIIHYVEQPYEHSKLAIINRFHRTLKSIFQKYFISQDTDRWIDIYDDVIYNYNNRVHRLFNKPPSKVTKKDILDSNFSKELEGLQAVKLFKQFKVGDKVRYLTKRNKFEKGNKTYSKKIYEIDSINGFSFKLKDIKTGNLLKNKGGTVQDFRYHELLKVGNVQEAPFIEGLPKARTQTQKKADNKQRRFIKEVADTKHEAEGVDDNGNIIFKKRLRPLNEKRRK